MRRKRDVPQSQPFEEKILPIPFTIKKEWQDINDQVASPITKNIQKLGRGMMNIYIGWNPQPVDKYFKHAISDVTENQASPMQVFKRDFQNTDY